MLMITNYLSENYGCTKMKCYPILTVSGSQDYSCSALCCFQGPLQIALAVKPSGCQLKTGIQQATISPKNRLLLMISIYS